MKKSARLDEASIEKIKSSFKQRIKHIEEKVSGFIVYSLFI